MQEAYRGLLGALHPNWRGGVTCKVLHGGEIRIGDAASVVSSPVERQITLPG
jgi:MOSC domain-containing protein YiiM